MGVGKHTKAVEKNGRWRVPSLVASAILIVALATGGALVGLQRLHAADARWWHDEGTHDDDPAPAAFDHHLGLTGAGNRRRRLRHERHGGFLPAAGQRQPVSDPLARPARQLGENARLRLSVSFLTATSRPTPRCSSACRAALEVSADNLGQSLSSTLRKKFVIEGASELRLQQLLAELGYLPLEFVPGDIGLGRPSATVRLATEIHSRTRPRPRTDSTPSPLPAIDSEPTDPTQDPSPARRREPRLALQRHARLTQGAVDAGAAQRDHQGRRHGLRERPRARRPTGFAGPKVWAALLQAVALRQVTTQPYDYVSVTENRPETATVWRDGQDIFSTLVNTGIPVAPTAPGTYPVYARYLVTTMTGKNPNGTPYSDPGIPWVSYFNGGDALHGFIRAQLRLPPEPRLRRDDLRRTRRRCTR